MNLLEVKNLWVRFQKFSAVRGVSLALKVGEFVALVGNSGSGKSTIAHAILRLQKNVRYEGEIYFKRQNLLKLSEEKIRAFRGLKIAMIFQEPMNSLNPLHTVGKQILEALWLYGKPAEKNQVLKLLNLVELPDVERIYNSYPHALSGGQRQRVMIAMALAGSPHLLIADEPTTALDVTVQAQILKLLKVLQQKLGLAILFITHDLDIVRKMADRVYVMRGGVIISTKLPPVRQVSTRAFVPAQKNDVVLDVRDLSIFYGSFEALKPTSFQLSCGQTLGIVGESGSGKSSLAQALIRLIPAKGHVRLCGKDFFTLSGKNLVKARANIQMVLQDPAGSLNPRMSIRQIVEEGLLVHQSYLSVKERFQLVDEVIKSVDLRLDILDRYPHEISGGQKTRVALARVLILKPKVLILDEVTASLDVTTQNQLVQLLLKLQDKLGLVYLFISHDMRLIRTVSDYVLVLKNGVPVEHGTQGQVFQCPSHRYTQELIRDSFLNPNLG